jgi:hypothetical protein
MGDAHRATSFALFRGDQQISKTHSTVYAVRVEAQQRNLVSQPASRQFFPDGYEIREVPDETDRRASGCDEGIDDG